MLVISGTGDHSKMSRPSEHMEQVRFVSWFKKNYEDKGYLIYAVPNGGHRSKSEAGKLKAEGVRRGVSDMHIPALKLWIELKRDDKEKPTDEQVAWGEHVKSLGDSFFVAYGFLDAMNKTKKFIDDLVDN